MDLYRIAAFAHLLGAVLLVGLALFWFIMSVALRQRFDAVESARLLRVVNGARWPHVIVPYSLRLPLPWMSWLVLVVLLVSGALMLSLSAAHGQSELWWAIKKGLLALILVLQVVLTLRPSPLLIRLNLILVLAVVVASGLMLRG